MTDALSQAAIPTEITHPAMWGRAAQLKAERGCACNGPANVNAHWGEWCPCACLDDAADEAGIGALLNLRSEIARAEEAEREAKTAWEEAGKLTLALRLKLYHLENGTKMDDPSQTTDLPEPEHEMIDAPNQGAERILEFLLEERAREAEEALQKLLAEIKRQKPSRAIDAPIETANIERKVRESAERFNAALACADAANLDVWWSMVSGGGENNTVIIKGVERLRRYGRDGDLS